MPAVKTSHLRWLKANGVDLGALTGTDTKALAAIAAAWELYTYTGDDDVLLAIGLLTGTMQSKLHPLARELAAFAMDWGDRDRLWPKVVALVKACPLTEVGSKN